MAHMMYVDLVLLPAGVVVKVNPLMVCGIMADLDRPDESPATNILFPMGEWTIMGDERLVTAVLSGEHDAITRYDKKFTKPARKEGPRKLVPAHTTPGTEGGILIDPK